MDRGFGPASAIFNSQAVRCDRHRGAHARQHAAGGRREARRRGRRGAGTAAGTLGGGCVEADAILAARDVIRAGGRSLRAYELTEDLAWNTGLVCGGTMWILAERADDALRAGRRDSAGRSGRAPRTAARRWRSSTLLDRAGPRSAFGGRVFVDAAGRADGHARRRARSTPGRRTSGLAQLPHGTRPAGLDRRRARRC